MAPTARSDFPTRHRTFTQPRHTVARNQMADIVQVDIITAGFQVRQRQRNGPKLNHIPFFVNTALLTVVVLVVEVDSINN